MKSVNSNSRLMVGDSVSWVSKSKTHYTGTVVNIKEGSYDYLIVVYDIEKGLYRSFYDLETDWWNTI